MVPALVGQPTARLKVVKAKIDGVWKTLDDLYNELQLRQDKDEVEDINNDLDSNSNQNKNTRKFSWSEMISVVLFIKA